MEVAQREERTLITFEKHFAYVVLYPPAFTHGEVQENPVPGRFHSEEPDCVTRPLSWLLLLLL